MSSTKSAITLYDTELRSGAHVPILPVVDYGYSDRYNETSNKTRNNITYTQSYMYIVYTVFFG